MSDSRIRDIRMRAADARGIAAKALKLSKESPFAELQRTDAPEYVRALHGAVLQLAVGLEIAAEELEIRPTREETRKGQR